jgi:hypothetical protein
MIRELVFAEGSVSPMAPTLLIVDLEFLVLSRSSWMGNLAGHHGDSAHLARIHPTHSCMHQKAVRNTSSPGLSHRRMPRGERDRPRGPSEN